MKDFLISYIATHYGIGVLLSLGVLIVTIKLLANWPRIKIWPGVSLVLKYLSRGRIPHADPERFSVLVAHLIDDASLEFDNLIVEALKEFEGVQVLRLDRTIPLHGVMPEQAEKDGRKKALKYIERSGASVVIWGIVLRNGNRSVPKLYWTSADHNKINRYDPSIDALLSLPELFWSDLVSILRMLIVSSMAKLHSVRGQFIADRLPYLINQVRTLLDSSEGRPGWELDGIGATSLIMADVLRIYGDQVGDDQPFQEAVVYARKALETYPRASYPVEWAKSQNSLGSALYALGKRDNDIQLLKEAITAFKDALEIRKPQTEPRAWAVTKNNIGIAFCSLGERNHQSAHIESAVSAYREVLSQGYCEPSLRASILNNLGVALGVLSGFSHKVDLLQRSVAAFKESLEYLPGAEPIDRAETLTNIGTALTGIGNETNSCAPIEEAVSVLQESLKLFRREEVPVRWAGAQSSLGVALCSLAQAKGGIALYEDGVGALRKALNVYTRESTPILWGKAQYNLGNALFSLGEVECLTASLNDHVVEWGRGATRFRDAITAYHNAMEIFTEEYDPAQFKDCKNNLGLALQACEDCMEAEGLVTSERCLAAGLLKTEDSRGHG
jgi:tetratricopeptide (TPR) repeat protein